MGQYRQGDVLLVRVEGMPSGVAAVAREDGRIVLAHGEATGHAHVVRERHSRLFRGDAEQVFLDVPVAARLEHEEHSTIDLEPGVYRVIRQREYSPERSQYVAD